MSTYDVSDDDIFFDASDAHLFAATPSPPPAARRSLVVTDASIAKMEPETRRYWVFDTIEPTLAVCVHPSGHKSLYYLRRRRVPGQLFKKCIATVGQITCDEARRVAAEHWQRRAIGVSAPSDEHLRAATVSGAFAGYCFNHLNSRNVAYAGQVQRLWTKFVETELGQRRISTISRFDWDQVIDRATLAGRTHGNALQKSLKTFLYWCVENNLIEANPLARRPIPAPPRRSRHLLTTPTIAGIYAASREMKSPWREIIGLIILTGANVDSIRHLQCDDVDWVQALYRPTSCEQMQREHWEPLSEQALLLLQTCRPDSRLFFQSSRKQSIRPYELRVSVLRELQERANSWNWSWIDLVHSTRSRMASIDDGLLRTPVDPDEPSWRARPRALANAWAQELLAQHDLAIARALEPDCLIL